MLSRITAPCCILVGKPNASEDTLPPSSGLKSSWEFFAYYRRGVKETGHVGHECHPPDRTVLQPIRPQYEPPLMRKPEILDFKVTFCSQPKLDLLILVRGHAVAHLVEIFRYKPEGRGFDSRRCHNPSSRAMALELDSASKRSKYQEYLLNGKGGRCLRLTLSLSCADFHEI